MKTLLTIILTLFLFCESSYALVTIRRDKVIGYMVVYYATIYTATVYRDKDIGYIIIPGDFDSEDFSFSYSIAPDMYPVSSGLGYRWRIQNYEWHHKFKRQRDVNAAKEY